MSIVSSFKSIENKHDVYSGKDCMKRFCESVREHAMKLFNFKKKKNEVICKPRAEIIINAKICYVCKKNLKINMEKVKKYCKVRVVKFGTIVIIQWNIKVLKIVYVIQIIVCLKEFL